MKRQQIHVQSYEDRKALVSILVSNGYTTRLVVKKANFYEKLYFIEYWIDTGEDDDKNLDALLIKNS